MEKSSKMEKNQQYYIQVVLFIRKDRVSKWGQALKVRDLIEYDYVFEKRYV